MTRNQWMQVLAVVIVLGMSGLSALFRKLQEKAAQKRAQEERERRESERLRTGRTAAAPVPSPQDLQAERRRAQLEELRRRAAERARRQAPQPTARTDRVVIQVPGSSGPIVVSRAPKLPVPARVPVPQRSRPQKTARAGERARPAQSAKRRPRPEPVPEPIEEAPARGLAQPTRPIELLTPPSVHDAVPRTAADWRRAMIMSEIFGHPVSMRQPSTDPWAV